MGNRNSQKVLFALPSVTYALRSAQLLNKYNIYATQLTIDPRLTGKGCTNGIGVERRDMQRARDILIDNNIPISRVIGG